MFIFSGVGENLRDHIAPRMVYKITKPGIAYNDKARGINLVKQVANYIFKRDWTMRTTFTK